MKNDSLKRQLGPWGRVASRRGANIRSAAAKALAPYDEYIGEKEKLLRNVLSDKGPGWKCIYCQKDATDWDHLVPPVKDKRPTGYGHQWGNLVPSCALCNKEKASKSWQEFAPQHEGATNRITKVMHQFNCEPDVRVQNHWDQISEAVEQAIECLREIDRRIDEARHKDS